MERASLDNTTFKIYFLLLVAFSLPFYGLGSPAPGVIYAAAPKERGAYHIGRKGSYNYGYNTGDGIAKVEVRNNDGSVTGSYRYYDPNGKQIVRSYIADKRGFRVLGNELPVSPDAPALGILEEQTLLGTTEGDKRISIGDNFLTVQQPPTFSNDLSNYYAGVERHNEAIRKQEELIRRQTEMLENLRSNRKHALSLDNLSQQRNYQTLNGYIETSNDISSLNTPYFYSEDNIAYDFPAGFAYDAPVQYQITYPVGEKRFHTPPTLTAGHNTNIKHTPVYIRQPNIVRTRYRKPVVDSYWNKQNYQREYVIGHAK